jgi:hypothetical protein
VRSNRRRRAFNPAAASAQLVLASILSRVGKHNAAAKHGQGRNEQHGMASGERQNAPRAHAATGPDAAEVRGSAREIRRRPRLWTQFKRLTQLGFPRRYPIVQFPNAPLIITFVAGQAGHLAHGVNHSYTSAVGYLAMAIWAYEEAAHGVNGFRHALGLAYLVIMVVRVAHALHS